MTDFRHPEELLPKAVADRLLARASELDANSASIAELRAAATEAGISGHAFDAALAEVRQAKTAEVLDASARRRTSPLFKFLVGGLGAFVVLLGLGMVIIPSRATPVRPARAEHQVQLRCITPERAAELARPFVDGSSTVVAHPGGDLFIVGTTDQIEKIQSAIDEYERSSVACAVAKKGPVKKAPPG
jgi:hypothetical protein